jgi:hypothetical protein
LKCAPYQEARPIWNHACPALPADFAASEVLEGEVLEGDVPGGVWGGAAAMPATPRPSVRAIQPARRLCISPLRNVPTGAVVRFRFKSFIPLLSSRAKAKSNK